LNNSIDNPTKLGYNAMLMNREIKKILNTESYVRVDPDIMNTPEFRFVHAIKDEIRAYKWKMEIKEDIKFPWKTARKEYLKKHKKALKSLFNHLIDFTRDDEEECIEIPTFSERPSKRSRRT